MIQILNRVFSTSFPLTCKYSKIASIEVFKSTINFYIKIAQTTLNQIEN